MWKRASGDLCERTNQQCGHYANRMVINHGPGARWGQCRGTDWRRTSSISDNMVSNNSCSRYRRLRQDGDATRCEHHRHRLIDIRSQVTTPAGVAGLNSVVAGKQYESYRLNNTTTGSRTIWHRWIKNPPGVWVLAATALTSAHRTANLRDRRGHEAIPRRGALGSLSMSMYRAEVSITGDGGWISTDIEPGEGFGLCGWGTNYTGRQYSEELRAEPGFCNNKSVKFIPRCRHRA